MIFTDEYLVMIPQSHNEVIGFIILKSYDIKLAL